MDQNSNTPPPFEPNNPGQGEGNGDLELGKPAVASAPSRIFTVIGAGAAFVAIVVYFVVFGGGGGKEVPPGQTSIPPSNISKLQPPPPPPTITEDPPPPTLPVPTTPGQLVQPPIPTPPILKENDPTNESRVARIRSNMIVFGGAGSSREKKEDGDCMANATNSNDPNNAFACKLKSTEAKREVATKIGRLENVIAQGKVIHAVMETAINTQLPGSVRAITSRDTYAEGGTNPLIPKGSRLIGVYNTDVFQGQARVFIVWNRVIRPDGIDVKLDSPGVDQLGRAGLPGAVDNKFPQIFTTALLSSLVIIGTAYAADEISGEDTTTTTNPDGSTTSTGNATTQAAADSAARIGGTVERTLDKIIDTRPTITVDQGTRINVLVNQDLIFPPSIAGSAYTVP